MKYREFKDSRNSPEGSTQARKSFRATVKTAKKEHWRKQVESATSQAQVFKVMRWAKPKVCHEPPPLKVAVDRWISDPHERAESLRDTSMARFNPAHGIPMWECGQRESILWNHTLSLDDVTVCTIESGDNAPGSDEITVRLLKSYWNEIGEHVRDIFQACLKISYFPTDFRVAEVVLLLKPGRDPTTAKGCRPISLLSCFVKCLERLVAK